MASIVEGQAVTCVIPIDKYLCFDSSQAYGCRMEIGIKSAAMHARGINFLADGCTS